MHDTSTPTLAPSVTADTQPATPLYADVAARVAAMIAGGTFRPGERLPSVRALHAQLGVSITTVLQAYRLLALQRYSRLSAAPWRDRFAAAFRPWW